MKIHLEHLPPIGKRKLKSLFGLFLGFWVWQVIRLFAPGLEVHPIYIYFYSIIEIRETSEKTVSMGRLRLKSTAVALVIGLLFLLMMDWLKQMLPASWMHTALELLMLLVGTLLTLTVAEYTGCQNFCGLAAAIFILMIVLHAKEDRYVYTLLRSSQTLIGVAIAWIINVKWFPYSGPEPESEK